MRNGNIVCGCLLDFDVCNLPFYKIKMFTIYLVFALQPFYIVLTCDMNSFNLIHRYIFLCCFVLTCFADSFGLLLMEIAPNLGNIILFLSLCCVL